MNKNLDERDELIKSINNRCLLYWYLKEVDEDVKQLLPTLLEDLYCDAQTLVHEFCARGE